LEAGLEDFAQASGGKYPVRVEWVAPEQSEARLAELKAAGTPPDVFMTRAADLKRHVATRETYALDGELAKDPKWQERFPAPLLCLLSVRGKTYALPITQTVAVVYYHKEIFRKHGLAAPATYADLKKAVQVLRRNGITPIAFGNREGWEGALLSQLIETRLGGGRLFEQTQSGTGEWTNPSLVPAGRVLAELVRLRARLLELQSTMTGLSLFYDDVRDPEGSRAYEKAIRTILAGIDPATVDLAKMSACWRQRVIAFFLERKLLNERLAKNMIEWAHSGFKRGRIDPHPGGLRQDARSAGPVHRAPPGRARTPWSIALPTAIISTPT
jgi:hypothetical protein